MKSHLLVNQEKSSWTNRCLLALLSLLAFGGVGIGVFSVIHSSSLQNDINELRSQLKALQNNTPASNATVAKLVAEFQAVEAEVLSINQFLGDESVVTTLQCLDDATKLAYAPNGMAVARCPANCDASVSASHLWGTHIYSSSSSICLAAVQDGELQLSAGGVIRVVQKPGQNHYTGSTQNGVTSSDKDGCKSSFGIGTTLRQNVSDVVESTRGEMKMFFTDSCPPGWKETNNRGYLLATTPVGGTSGTTNGESALQQQEKGRVGPHGHTVSDPGHSHGKRGERNGGSGSDENCRTRDVTGSPSAGYFTYPSATTGLSVDDHSGDYYPLVYVLLCQKES